MLIQRRPSSMPRSDTVTMLGTPPPSLHARRPDLPAALDAVFARALAKRVADRFDSCAEFAAAVRRALDETGAQPTVFAGHSMPLVPQQSYPDRHPQSSHGAVSQSYSGYAQPPFAMPAQPNPGHAMPVRRRSRMPIVFLLVMAAVLGAGYWVWQDEQSALADLPQRSQGHKDLDALHEAFPQMMPAGYGNGHCFGGRNCSATVKPLRYSDPWTKTFDGYAASRSCGDEKMVDTPYAFYTYPTAEAAAAVVTRFRQETKDHGRTSTGTRTDDRREQSADGQYNGSAIISTFSEPARARWVEFTPTSAAPMPATSRTALW